MNVTHIELATSDIETSVDSFFVHRIPVKTRSLRQQGRRQDHDNETLELPHPSNKAGNQDLH